MKDRINSTKRMLYQKEQELSEQRIVLLTKLFKLKDIEIKARQSCRCKGRCSITHSKHNWISSKSDKFLQAMTNLKQVGEDDNDLKNTNSEAIYKPYFHNPWGLTFLNFEQSNKLTF